MLNKIDLNLETLSKLNGKEYDIVAELVKEVLSGKKVVAFKQTTKSAVFINRYEYDNTKWRYILTDKYKL